MDTMSFMALGCSKDMTIDYFISYGLYKLMNYLMYNLLEFCMHHLSGRYVQWNTLLVFMLATSVMVELFHKQSLGLWLSGLCIMRLVVFMLYELNFIEYGICFHTSIYLLIIYFKIKSKVYTAKIPKISLIKYYQKTIKIITNELILLEIYIIKNDILKNDPTKNSRILNIDTFFKTADTSQKFLFKIYHTKLQINVSMKNYYQKQVYNDTLSYLIKILYINKINLQTCLLIMMKIIFLVSIKIYFSIMIKKQFFNYKVYENLLFRNNYISTH